MLIASIFKELRLLSRDLHGVAVLFMMPILFMLIMSAALSNDNELSHQSEIVLLSESNNSLNHDFFKALQRENLNIQQADLSQLEQYQTALQAGKFELLIANFNTEQTALNKEQALQLWLNPSVDRGWLLGVKGVLQKHYTEQRIQHYLKDNHITLENNKRKQIKEIENKVNKELDQKFSQINDYLAKDLWQEVYLNRQGKEVAKPNSVQPCLADFWYVFYYDSAV